MIHANHATAIITSIFFFAYILHPASVYVAHLTNDELLCCSHRSITTRRLEPSGNSLSRRTLSVLAVAAQQYC